MSERWPILQPGAGAIRATEYLPADPELVLWGESPSAADAWVLSVASGTEVTIDTISHEGILEDQGRDPAGFFAGHGMARDAVLDDAIALAASAREHDPTRVGPHVITGPIRVEGAQPGDLLKMTLIEALPRVPYGVISNRHGKGALSGVFPQGDGNVSVFAGVDDEGRGVIDYGDGSGRAVRFPLNPFLGTMGVAVAGDARAHSVPPGLHGGNIDIALLTEGASLYLPVQVAGALAYIGDPHFAQGDGEVALTAMEASLRATVRFEVVDAAEAELAFGRIVGPMAETSEFLIPTGLDDDLDLAVRKAVQASIALIVARYGMTPANAYAYLSAATDFRISQVVDVVKGVHATIRVADFL